MRPVLRLVVALMLPLAALPSWAADAWTELASPGTIVLVRHATAPGVGDPPGMRLDDCATQRNLDGRGREEARRLGGQFRQRGVEVGRVLTSQWCRTRETARLAFGAQARDEPVFNSFFSQETARREAQTRDARALLLRWTGPGTLVVVTHQVNITALTGEVAASSEGVVLRPRAGARLEVVGTLGP